MTMSLPMTSQDFTSDPWGSATNERVFALTSLAMCSSQVLNSQMRYSSEAPCQSTYCSTLSFMSLRICWILLMSSLA